MYHLISLICLERLIGRYREVAFKAIVIIGCYGKGVDFCCIQPINIEHNNIILNEWIVYYRNQLVLLSTLIVHIKFIARQIGL